MRHRRAVFIVPFLLGVLALAAGELRASTQGMHIVNTPHNLSRSGPGTPDVTAASDEDRVCVFCHTPHNSSLEGPLWSRKSNISMYTLYGSPTIKALPEQPQGVSRLCLSCHDGTVALGLLLYSHETSKLGAIPKGRNTNLGTDLSNSHPISIIYPDDPEFSDKTTLEFKGIRLGFDSYVECISCHDPHNNQYGNFLVEDTSAKHDALCVECHNKKGWTTNEDATHRTGGQRFPDAIAQVNSDGCVNCHRPHFAQRGVHLLKQPDSTSGEETNCISTCHKGAAYAPTGGDVASQFSLDYKHPVQLYPDQHVENETLPVASGKKHVQCVDCHNPHQSGYQGSPLGSATPAVAPPSKAPEVNGPLRGVRGVTITGDPVSGDGYARYEYQICFKCHAGSGASSFKSTSTQRPVRVFTSYDESLRFASASVSYHPVTNFTVGGTGRSLISTYQNINMQIYCSDCHAPHGSTEPYILRASNADTFPSSALSYPLCFRCHDETFLYGTSGTHTLHQSHVRNHLVPCASCHDPHGIPTTLSGVTSSNASHLINFDTRYTGVGASYDGTAHNCTVAGTCHTSGGARSYTTQ